MVLKKKMAMLLVAALGCTAGAQARDLTVISWGGAFQDAQREHFFKPFTEETGIRVIDESWGGGVGVVRARAETAGDPGWDIIHAEAEEVLLGADEGLYEAINWAAIPERERLLPAAAPDFAVGAASFATGIAYDADRIVGAQPASAADFFDVEKFPGKRALRNGPKFNLELALIADGVPLEQVYTVLATPEGVDRAFAKLESIKPSLVFYESGGQALQLLGSGEVVQALTFSGRVPAANQSDKRNFRFVWDGSIFSQDGWVILKNSPNKEAAQKFVAFVSRQAPQQAFATAALFGVSNRDASAALPEEVARHLPTSPANFSRQLPVDAQFWTDHIESLGQRFSAFAGK